jgi:hypothetical protein
MLTDADELFTEMAERGVFPDLYTLTTHLFVAVVRMGI